MSETAESPRRTHIVEAAGRLFRASGFRAVTMEAIAAEAGVAKATLYSYFSDKNTVFAAVADHVTRLIAHALERGLAGKGDVDERMARGLIERHQRIFQLVDGSSHARELMKARDSFARAPVEKIDARMIEAIAAVLREDPVFSRSADSIARTLFRACVGVSGLARSVDEVEIEIGNFVRPYLLGLRTMSIRDERRADMAGGSPRKARMSGRG